MPLRAPPRLALPQLYQHVPDSLTPVSLRFPRFLPQLVEPREPSLEVLGDVHTADYLHRIHHHNLTIVQASGPCVASAS